MGVTLLVKRLKMAVFKPGVRLRLDGGSKCSCCTTAFQTCLSSVLLDLFGYLMPIWVVSYRGTSLRAQMGETTVVIANQGDILCKALTDPLLYVHALIDNMLWSTL